jgi:hypothetical protein
LQSPLKDSVDGKRDPEVGTWEFGDGAKENGADQGDLLIQAFDGIDMALGEVCCKARCSFGRGEESDHIIRIK